MSEIARGRGVESLQVWTLDRSSSLRRCRREIGKQKGTQSIGTMRKKRLPQGPQGGRK